MRAEIQALGRLIKKTQGDSEIRSHEIKTNVMELRQSYVCIKKEVQYIQDRLSYI